MCCRFYAPTKVELPVPGFLTPGFGNLKEPVKTGVVSPGDIVAVAARNRRQEPGAFAMQWGYHLTEGKLVFNTRIETAAVKPLFADGIRQRRCLIPAVCYYEWQKTEQGKQKYSISPADQQALLLGGIYRLEGRQAVFSILTQPPAEEVAFIHDRMPVMLPAEAAGDWLNPQYRAEDVLRALKLPLSWEAC